MILNGVSGLLLIIMVWRYGDMELGMGIFWNVFICVDNFRYHGQYATLSLGWPRISIVCVCGVLIELL